MLKNSAIKILVLDDDPITLKLIGMMLDNFGVHSASLFSSGQVALAQMDQPDGLPDVVLLDLNMPEMDGIEFVRHLVERGYTGSIILVSGEDGRVLKIAENLIHLHQIALPGILRKPVTPEGLRALLDKCPPPSRDDSLRASGKEYSGDELRAALMNRELVNYYQPKVHVATGRVVGVETLVRWQHPADGLVRPARFIGVAETHGLIDELTRRVLSDALAQAGLWQQAGLVLQLAVNVSINNLDSPDFADSVAKLVTAADVPPQQVVLEMAESRIMVRDLHMPLETLSRLRLKRFRLSIDDFGTGHSSLARLRDIPFDELKIDPGFVHGASGDKAVRAKYEASLSIARQLNMEVVAEGVEDRDDWEFIRKSGCDLAQGHFIAHPMPAADLSGWMQDWQARKEFAVVS